MKKIKSFWLTITGSASSLAPVLLSCCKSGACVGVCASPVASLFGVSSAGIANSPLVAAFEPLLIAISAVAFTISYYSLYVLPKYKSCSTEENCDCKPTPKDLRKTEISKNIFWIGLTASIIFLSYFEYQKYQSHSNAACSPSGYTTTQSSIVNDTTTTKECAAGSGCCDTTTTSK